VQELRRITLLWDELWLGTLVQHHAEISRRLQQLELEVLRVEDNASLSLADKDRLITEKHRIILKPVSNYPFCLSSFATLYPYACKTLSSFSYTYDMFAYDFMHTFLFKIRLL
jgi:hypothetical protein